MKVGDIVLYHCGPHEEFNGTKVAPAIITRVWDEDLLNLYIFKDAGKAEARTSVPMRGSPRHHDESASWSVR